jgi:hypothetical protein
MIYFLVGATQEGPRPRDPATVRLDPWFEPTSSCFRSDRSALTQRAVAIRALGWRLRVESCGAQSFPFSCSEANTTDLVGQSPPGRPYPILADHGESVAALPNCITAVDDQVAPSEITAGIGR